MKNLEGERDHGRQTLATCTFLRSHVRRGVVKMVLVNVKMQGVKSRLYSTDTSKCVFDVYVHQSHIFAPKKKTLILYVIVW